MIFGFLGLFFTLPSLAYFLRMALREMKLVKYRKLQADEDSTRYLADEPLSAGFVEFMKGENANWKSAGDEFGTKSPPGAQSQVLSLASNDRLHDFYIFKLCGFG